MSRVQRAVQSNAWRRRVQGLACARQVQSKAGEGLTGLCWQFGCTQVQLLGSARAANSVVAVPTSTDPMGILKSTREFKAPGAGKEHTSAVRGGGRDPGVRRPGSGLGRPTARSKFFRAAMHFPCGWDLKNLILTPDYLKKSKKYFFSSNIFLKFCDVKNFF